MQQMTLIKSTNNNKKQNICKIINKMMMKNKLKNKLIIHKIKITSNSNNRNKIILEKKNKKCLFNIIIMMKIKQKIKEKKLNNKNLKKIQFFYLKLFFLFINILFLFDKIKKQPKFESS